MDRLMLRAKIHRATVTDANVDYEGSITIDSALLRLADILPNEQVHVVNVTNGERLITYAIAGGPGEICLNGAAAHRCRPGEIVIIMAYASLREDELHGSHPGSCGSTLRTGRGWRPGSDWRRPAALSSTSWSSVAGSPAPSPRSMPPGTAVCCC